MWFSILYFLFVFCSGVLAIQTYGLPLTIRQIFAVVMFVSCFVVEQKFWADKFVRLYLLFVLCFGVSCLATGYLGIFVNRLIGDYFVAYVAIWSTKILIENLNTYKPLVYIILLIGIIDGTITFSQFLGITIFDPFINACQLISYSPYLDLYQGVSMLDRSSPGIFSTPTLNGHVLIMCTLFSLVPLFKERIIHYILWIFMSICLFSTQQRTSFYLTMLLSFFAIFKELSQSRHSSILRTLFFFVIIIGGLLFFEFISNGNFRFSELGTDSTGRDKIYSDSIQYILSHPLGGIYLFFEEAGHYPHNLFLNAFIYGGWFGGLFLVKIIIYQINFLYKVLYNSNNSVIIMVFSCVSVAMLGNGITHNTSIVNGEFFTVISWTAFYYYYLKDIIDY